MFKSILVSVLILFGFFHLAQANDDHSLGLLSLNCEVSENDLWMGFDGYLKVYLMYEDLFSISKTAVLVYGENEIATNFLSMAKLSEDTDAKKVKVTSTVTNIDYLVDIEFSFNPDSKAAQEIDLKIADDGEVTTVKMRCALPEL